MVNPRSSRPNSIAIFGLLEGAVVKVSPSPVAEAFAKMLEHIQQSENRLDQLQSAMCDIDPNSCKKEYDKLCLEDLDVIGRVDINEAEAGTEKK